MSCGHFFFSIHGVIDAFDRKPKYPTFSLNALSFGVGSEMGYNFCVFI